MELCRVGTRTCHVNVYVMANGQTKPDLSFDASAFAASTTLLCLGGHAMGDGDDVYADFGATDSARLRDEPSVGVRSDL
jgi:hypothetical protein